MRIFKRMKGFYPEHEKDCSTLGLPERLCGRGQRFAAPSGPVHRTETTGGNCRTAGFVGVHERVF